MESPVSATESQVRDRCKRLADAELIPIDLNDWRLEICGLGQRYLKGEVDVALNPYPRNVRNIDEERSSRG